MTVLGLTIDGDHARLITAVLGALLAAASFFAGRWSRHRQRVRFRKEDLVASTVVTELYGFSDGEDGRRILHIVSQGGTRSTAEVFTNPTLIEHVQREARKHPGLVGLKNPIAHRMMMDEGKDRITGHDPKANMDFLFGRPTREDEVLFGFGAWAETGDRRNALHDEIGRLVQMVVALRDVPRLTDDAFIAELGVQHAGYKPRIKRLAAFAREWQRLEALPHTERHAATDKIWKVTVRTSTT
jgi:hypothetical protein